MPGDQSDRARKGFARNFFCEHSASKSRVLALVATDGNESLRAVLTCTDRLLAESAASLLSQATNGGLGSNMNSEAERIATELPGAPAASFRQALQYACEGAWPIDDHDALPTYDQVHDSYGYVLTDDQAVTPWLRDSATRTPSDARLADLTGPVLRVITMLELHVFDSKRLLAAAKLTGWTPPSDEDDDADEQDDILDAAMVLAGDESTIPGVDIVTEAGQGQHLVPGRGDETSDWSDQPIEASFGTGWRARHFQDTATANSDHSWPLLPNTESTEEPPTTSASEQGSTQTIRAKLAAVADRVRHPSLPLIYFVSGEAIVDDAIEDDADIPEVEREPARLRRAALALAADEIIERCVADLQTVDFDRNGQVAGSDGAEESFVYEFFPSRFRSSYNERFFRDILVTAVKVAYDLADPNGEEATCTAEEIVRQAIGELATVWWDMSDLGEPLLTTDEMWLEDTDFEYLYDKRYDGLEDDPAQQAGMGISVSRPEGWFAPFNDGRIVHPYTETEPSNDHRLHDLYQRLSEMDSSPQTVLTPDVVDAPSPVSSLAAASEVVAVVRRGSDRDDLSLWIADDSDAEGSFASLVAAASQDHGSGWLVWEPYQDADTVRTEPVVHLLPHRHFPVGSDEPWAEVAIGGGRIIAVPLRYVVSYRPDPDVRRRWNAAFAPPTE